MTNIDGSNKMIVLLLLFFLHSVHSFNRSFPIMIVKKNKLLNSFISIIFYHHNPFDIGTKKKKNGYVDKIKYTIHNIK